MKDAVLVFDASIKVLKREYRDVEGFSITDAKRIEADRFGSEERDVFRNEVYSIRYRVSFTQPKMAKGAVGKVEGLTWSYTNSGLAMCPHYPRGLLLNKRYRFYVYGISKGSAREIKLLELPQPVK